MRDFNLVLSLACVSIFALSASAAPETSPKTASPTETVAANAAAPVYNSYVIGPEDVLLVRVWRDPEVSGPVVVRPDGKITLQLLGEIQAGGRTPEALTELVYDGLAKLKTLDKSEVTVTVTSVNSKKYYVQGEVIKAGAYPLIAPTRVLDALVSAGGFREFANQKKILILRGAERLHFNYKEIIAGKNREQNIYLQPGDQIIVP